MGRRKKPSKLRRLEGNPYRQADGATEPEPVLTELEPPEVLSDAAVKEWQRVAPELIRLGLLTDLDRTALAIYCQAYGRWQQAELKLSEEGLVVEAASGYQSQSPYLSIANKAFDQMRRMATEFGMSPRSRPSVAGVAAKPRSQIDQTIDDLLD